ncbi:MAG: STAS domain-containing protein [Gammaproteobacteria bacterium]|nr:STAS domain-containing protein [Gammaproteobacteria bacterium]MDH5777575.1 STAS domain-containing protein [Gammaproteobacteria bacterium]
MTPTKITQQVDGQFEIKGEINANTVPELWRAASSLINGANADMVFDLHAVTRSDSAGLALLVEWMRQARDKNVGIKFRNLPEQMMAIAKVSDLEEIIPLAD